MPAFAKASARRLRLILIALHYTSNIKLSVVAKPDVALAKSGGDEESLTPVQRLSTLQLVTRLAPTKNFCGSVRATYRKRRFAMPWPF